MNQALHIVAKTLSILLHPLFIPTYGIALFCYAIMRLTPMPLVWSLVQIIGTLMLTCILPITAIWILIRRGVVTDLQMEDGGERTMPYIYSAVSFCFWSYLMASILHAPLFLSFIAIGATVAITLVAVINHWWKISAHLTGLGGLVGGIFCYCLGIGAIPTWSTIGIWLALSLLLMYSRLYLNAHTPAQVSAGWLTGFACTFLPYCIYSYAA